MQGSEGKGSVRVRKGVDQRRQMLPTLNSRVSHLLCTWWFFSGFCLLALVGGEVESEYIAREALL